MKQLAVISIISITTILLFTGIAGCSKQAIDTKAIEDELAIKQAEIAELEQEIESYKAAIKELEKSPDPGITGSIDLSNEMDTLKAELEKAREKIEDLEAEIEITRSNSSPFQVSELQVISQDDTVTGATVSIMVSNRSNENKNYSVTIKIDGEEIERQEKSIPYESSLTFSFTIDRDISVFTTQTSGTSAVIEATSGSRLPNGYLLEKKLCSNDNSSKTYEITYISDGLRVKGYLAIPTGQGGPYPAIIRCRGGNRNYGLLEYFQTTNYAAQGYVCVGSQYRGNMGGQGQDQFGGDDVNDVINLIPLLKNMPEVDPDRIGIVGASRGGMMVYMVLRQQTLAGANDIKAAAVTSGAADLFMAVVERPEMLSSVYIPLIGGTPQQIPEEYIKRSATYWANDINVPILIQHGDHDENVDIAEAEKMVEELEKYGKTYKYIVYPGMGHDLTDGGPWFNEILTWFRTYLR